MTAIGQLVSNRFASFDRQLHDEELAGVATQVMTELLRGRKRGAQHRGR